VHAVLQKLLLGRPVVTDGAWGTQLQARGLAPGEFPDSWNLTFPERVAAVARAYVAAGSQILLTNTFGANRIRMADHTARFTVAEVNQQGVQISRQAAQGQARVFASIGPSGKLLITGDVTPQELQAAFREQAQALAGAGADGLVVETMSDLEEAKLAVGAAHDTGLPVVACMVFDCGKEKDRTMTGITPEQAAQALAEAGADVIGSNCGQGISAFIPLCQRLRAATDLPLWIKPNAGLPTVVEGRVEYHVTPEEFVRSLPDLCAAGASFVGGCCGTRPDFIAAIRHVLLNQTDD